MQIQVVLISDDYKYSAGVLEQLSQMNHDVVVREIDWNRIGSMDPEDFMNNDGDKSSTIIMFDFGFVRRACDSLIERALALKNHMVIECLAMRPPSDAHLKRRLINWDVPVFDTTQSSELVLQVVH